MNYIVEIFLMLIGIPTFILFIISFIIFANYLITKYNINAFNKFF
jgi:hypothetical protein